MSWNVTKEYVSVTRNGFFLRRRLNMGIRPNDPETVCFYSGKGVRRAVYIESCRRNGRRTT